MPTQRGRKSAGALTAVAALAGRAPALVPPPSLTAGERAVWKRSIDRLPLGWLYPEMLDVAIGYCGHAAEAARLRAAAAVADDLKVFAMLSGMARQESTLALAYARALRLTPHARIGARTAGRRVDGPRPAVIDALFGGRDES